MNFLSNVCDVLRYFEWLSISNSLLKNFHYLHIYFLSHFAYLLRHFYLRVYDRPLRSSFLTLQDFLNFQKWFCFELADDQTGAGLLWNDSSCSPSHQRSLKSGCCLQHSWWQCGELGTFLELRNGEDLMSWHFAELIGEYKEVSNCFSS